MYEGVEFQQAITFTVIECYKCHIHFAVDKRTKQRWRKTKEEFYCPAGHRQAYVKSDLDILQEKLDSANAQIVYQETQKKAAQAAARMATYRERAQKGAKTRLKNRIANGVCPCCTRTFCNLARHMATQHPDYKSTD